MDIIGDVYDLIKDDQFISEYVSNNYMFNDFPDVPDIETAYIAINPVVPGEPVFYMDGKRTGDVKSARVDVFLQSGSITDDNPRLVTADIMERISTILDDNHYEQTASFTPEYDKDHKLYRESRSFEINYYRSDY